MQIPGVIVMEMVSDKDGTNDNQWHRILITFNASSKEYTGAPSQDLLHRAARGRLYNPMNVTYALSLGCMATLIKPTVVAMGLWCASPIFVCLSTTSTEHVHATETTLAFTP